MTLVWEHAPASGNELLLLLAIADQANDLGADAWPSIDTLARRTRLNSRTVQRLLQRLAARQLLAIEPGGGRRSNRYALNLSVLADSAAVGRPAAAAPPARGHPRQGVTPDMAATRGTAQPDHPRGDAAMPPTPSSTSLSPSPEALDTPPTPVTQDESTTKAAKEISHLVGNFTSISATNRRLLESAVLGALRAGHSKAQLYELLSRSLDGARSPVAVIHARINQLLSASNALPQPSAWPEWCGSCDGPEPHSRWVQLDDGRVQACSNCNPRHIKPIEFDSA